MHIPFLAPLILLHHILFPLLLLHHLLSPLPSAAAAAACRNCHGRISWTSSPAGPALLTGRQLGRQTQRQTGRPYRRTCWQTSWQTDWQTSGQTCWQTGPPQPVAPAPWAAACPAANYNRFLRKMYNLAFKSNIFDRISSTIFYKFYNRLPVSGLFPSGNRGREPR